MVNKSQSLVDWLFYLLYNNLYKENYYMSKMYGPEEKAKLERLINEGSNVLREVEDLQEGLKETVKAVAEELDIKPALINKAIKIAQKRDWDKYADSFEDLETLVSTLGYDK